MGLIKRDVIDFALEANSDARVLIRPQTDDNPVIKLLISLLEDARRGGITTICAITVSPGGIVQTPAQGHQVREVARGLDAATKRMEESYHRAVSEARVNPQAPLRPMVG
jgi:hypothetical protein